MKLFLTVVALLGFTLHNALLFALRNKWVQEKLVVGSKLGNILGCFSLLTIFPPLACVLILVFMMPWQFALVVCLLFATAIVGVYRENKKLPIPNYLIRLKNSVTVATFVMLVYSLGQILGWWK
jgi:hypothetical protein